MKKRFILFACIVISAAFTTCRNEQVIGLLRFPSELDFLEVETYAEDLKMEGGAALVPGLRASVFEYTAHVAKDTDRFAIKAGFNGKGTVTGFDEMDQKAGTNFYFYPPIDEKVITLTVQKEWMKVAQYRLTIVRGDPIPVAEHINLTVDPEIGAFFIGSGVLPELEVTAELPAAGGELSYQWYRNTTSDTRSGRLLTGETGTTYQMREGETRMPQTWYYYVEVTNTLDGKTGVTVSPPCAVSFLNKNELDEKSIAMVPIPAGSVTAITGRWNSSSLYRLQTPWNTPGFSMGQNLVTWELWNTVFYYADKTNYRFARKGNQGGARGNWNNHTNAFPRPIGNRLHPVTLIGWREAVVWCNAYSEMNGYEPVYQTSDKQVLRDSRLPVETLIDSSLFDVLIDPTKKKGYRLPTYEEWCYAAWGASPGNSPPWTDKWPGTNNADEKDKYSWNFSLKVAANEAIRETGEVGSMLPLVLHNGSELYDILGMLMQWVWWASQQSGAEIWSLGDDFGYADEDECNFDSELKNPCPPAEAYRYDTAFMGFRLARNKE